MDRAAWELLAPWEPAVRERLDALLEGDGGQAHLRRVEAAHGREVARFVSLQRELRQRARARFPDGRLAALTSKGLEQATAPEVADLRAERFAEEHASRGGVAWDACCGLGSDAVSLTRAGVPVLATERDVEVARCASLNLADAPAAVALGDATAPPFRRGGRIMALLDPDRRSEGRRLAHPDDWSPSLPIALELCREAGLGCIKLPPGLDPMATALGGAADVSLEWVSLDGELRELAAWVGPWSFSGPRRRAVALRRSGTREECIGDGHTADPSPSPLVVGSLLVEFDPALRLAGLAREHGTRHGLRPVEGEAGYWTGAAEERIPLARRWRVLEVLPVDRKRVRAALRARGIGPLTVKTRGVRESAQELARRLRGPGDLPGLLAVTRTPRGAVAAVLEALDETPPETPLVGDEGLEPPAPSL